MTPAQRVIARKKNKIRVNKVLLASQYLIETHAEWKKRDINLEEVKSKLKNPVLVDNTTEEAGEASNVEQTESVKVFFPDGTMSTVQQRLSPTIMT